jgi:hypothetical protein
MDGLGAWGLEAVKKGYKTTVSLAGADGKQVEKAGCTAWGEAPGHPKNGYFAR